MSTIMRKPLIETIADSLDKDTLLKLNSDIDSSVGYSKYDLIEGFLPALADGQQSMTEKVTLVTNGKTLVGSYIKYDTGVDIHSYLLNYGEGVHKVYIYEIDEESRTTYLVGECLGVSELRRVIMDRLIEVGAAGGAGIKTLEINLQDYMNASDYSALVNGILRNEDFSGYYELTEDIDSTEYDRIKVNIPAPLDEETIPFVLVCNKVAQGVTPMFMSNFDWGRSDKPVVFFSICGSGDSLGYVSCIAKIQESSSTIIRRY